MIEYTRLTFYYGVQEDSLNKYKCILLTLSSRPENFGESRYKVERCD